MLTTHEIFDYFLEHDLKPQMREDRPFMQEIDINTVCRSIMSSFDQTKQSCLIMMLGADRLNYYPELLDLIQYIDHFNQIPLYYPEKYRS